MSAAARAMAAQRARITRPIKTGRIPLVSIPDNVVPLFSRRLPWWARNPGTAGLIVCDLIMTGAFIELTWNHWTEMEVIPPPTSSPEGTPSKIEWTLRPTWQRLGLCSVHLIAGCFFAGGLLGIKARFLRSVTILPAKAAAAAASSPATPAAKTPKGRPPTASPSPSPEMRTLLIQNASHPKNTGYEFPLHTSWLEEGRDKTELLLRSGESNSRWYLELSDAFINGKKYTSTDEARALLINEWKSVQPSLPPQRPKTKV